MAGTQQDVDSDFKDYDGSTELGSSIDEKIENVIATLIGCLDDITGIDGWLASNGACRLQTKVNQHTSDTSYAITNTDNYLEIWITPTTADRTCTLPDPTNALNTNRKIKIVNKGDGTYKVTVNPNASEDIIVYSGNEEWQLSSFELLQAGDYAEFIQDPITNNWIKCNAPYWHIVDDPATGSILSKTTAWTADSFPSGEEVTFSNLPIGAIMARGVALIYDASSGGSRIAWRKSGNSNISNTPFASNENSHILIYENSVSIYQQAQVEFGLSYDRKTQFASYNTTTNFYLQYPYVYLQ